MKKIIKIITMFIILVLLCETSYAAEYLNSVEFTEKSVNDTAMWSGREWITDRYPPKISQDGIEFTEVEGNEEVPEILKFGGNYKYVWTGSDYLVYKGHHPYLDADSKKYMYRISEDFKSILNTYQIPNHINNIEYMDDKIFISTRNVRPKKNGDSVMGVYSCENAVYYSTDCIEWTKLENDNLESSYPIYIYKVNNKLIIRTYLNSNSQYGDYLYSNGEYSKILYENNLSGFSYKVGQYLCKIAYNNENKTDDNTILEFSKDGIYRIALIVDKKMEAVQNISEVGDEILIEDYRKFYTCNKEEIFSQLREKLTSNPVYVKFNGNILGFETPPVIEDDSTLVPMRFLFEQMGADVEWNGETQNATATLDNKTVTFEIDNINAEVNNAPAVMDIPARLINGKTMVPLRFLSENMGYTVDWDADSRTAIIN